MVLSGPSLTVDALSPAIAAREGPARMAGPATMKGEVESLERHLLADALRIASGNQTRAARALGLSRFGLQKKLKRYGL